MMSFYSYLINVITGNKGLSDLPLRKHKQIYKEWSSQISSGKLPLDAELPWLTLIAKNCIEEFLIQRSREQTKIFEYGAGGSSLFFLKYADEVVSVEHDRKWFELVKNRVNTKRLTGWDGHLLEPEFIGSKAKADLDASSPHHYYTTDDRFLEHTFKGYASYIDKYPDNYFDLILVDGRSRPSCLHHGMSKIKKGGMLVLDNAEREYYLSKNSLSDFSLVSSSWGALICYNQFTRTNVYIKIK